MLCQIAGNDKTFDVDIERAKIRRWRRISLLSLIEVLRFYHAGIGEDEVDAWLRTAGVDCLKDRGELVVVGHICFVRCDVCRALGDIFESCWAYVYHMNRPVVAAC